MDCQRIEREAQAVNIKVWDSRESMFPKDVDPERTCEPWAAAAVLGLDLYEAETLGHFGNAGDRFQTAGALDRNGRQVLICTQFPRHVQRFTAAHEIGHFVLHDHLVMHRDRPLFDVGVSRLPVEREADYFAACFLAPAKLVLREFERRFCTRKPLPLNDTIAYYLRPDASHELLNAPTGSLAFAAAVAAARTFGAGPFVPLYEFFGISRGAMAIRLRELGLVAD